MGGSGSKGATSIPTKASNAVEKEAGKMAGDVQQAGLLIEPPERNSEWDEKSKWDSRSGLRSFCIAHHPTYGYLLLQAQKRKKGLHYQLAGGHVDQEEIDALGLHQSSRVACARELYEETGIDLREKLERLILCEVAPGVASLKGRVLYWVELTDEDTVRTFPARKGRSITPENGGASFQIYISDEHTGAVFEKSVTRAADMLQAHSGGKCSAALLRITELKKR